MEQKWDHLMISIFFKYFGHCGRYGKGINTVKTKIHYTSLNNVKLGSGCCCCCCCSSLACRPRPVFLVALDGGCCCCCSFSACRPRRIFLVHPAAVLKLISSARPRFLFDFVGGALFTYSAWAKSARAVKLL